MRRLFAPLATAAPWRESLHLVLDLPLGIAWFTIAITLLSVGGGLSITLIGLPILAATVLIGRWFGTVERARARLFLADDPPAPLPYRLTGSAWNKMRLAFLDRPGWKGLAYGIIMLPWGIITFTATVVVWSIGVPLALYPAYFWIIPNGDRSGPFQFGDEYAVNGFWSRFGLVAVTSVIGIVVVAATPRIVHALAVVDRGLIRSLLSRGHGEAMTQRVLDLEHSREASVESAAGELRRIERDLHDGAQQRLVSLAMNLGIAKDRLDARSDPHTVDLVTRAHDEAKQAIGELRDLVRGIHPAVLTDRGLDAAISALAARCPVPVELRSELQHRYAPAIEATGYFVVAEALTNIAKHSRAAHASVRLSERNNHLVIEIFDDGVGGAIDSHGGGLRGLRDRVDSVEGQLRIASPVGGPTTMIVEVPCGS